MKRPELARWEIVLLAGLTGLLLNLFPLPVAGQLASGRVPTLAVTILFGPWFGGAAALLGVVPFLTSDPSRAALLLAAPPVPMTIHCEPDVAPFHQSMREPPRSVSVNQVVPPSVEPIVRPPPVNDISDAMLVVLDGW